MNTVQRLEEIRRLQGLPAMPDPGVIQDGPIPVPPYPGFEPPDATERDPFEQDFPGEDPAYPDPNKSPLVAAAQAPAPKAEAFGKFIPASSDLLVYDSRATYQNHSVTLTETEKQQVVRTILGALERQLRELRGSIPRQRQRRAPGARKEVSEPATEPAAPKKRGRPRKVKA